MSVDPINPSDHVQAAMRLVNDRNNQAIDEVEVSRTATSAAEIAKVRADRVTLNSHVDAHLSPDGESAGSRGALGAESYRADLRRRQLEDMPGLGEMSVETFEAQAGNVARAGLAMDTRLASEGRLGAMNAAENRPDVAVSAAALNPPPQAPAASSGLEGNRPIMAVDASSAYSGLPNSKTHAARVSARYKRVEKMEDERMSILPRGRGDGSSSDFDDIDGIGGEAAALSGKGY